jgi:hypothetical protein
VNARSAPDFFFFSGSGSLTRAGARVVLLCFALYRVVEWRLDSHYCNLLSLPQDDVRIALSRRRGGGQLIMLNSIGGGIAAAFTGSPRKLSELQHSYILPFFRY